MPCYHPLKAFRTATGVVFSELGRFDVLGSIELPCGQCIGCRLERASQWQLRIMHEASLYDDNCFVTLTYDDSNCPAFGSLHYPHFQSFMRRLRKYAKSEVRFYCVGEYGPSTLRPHYHACLFGVDFSDTVPAGSSASGESFYESASLSKLWPHGFATVQPLIPQTAGYCARYITTKALGESAKTAYRRVDEDGVLHDVVPEFSRMSLKPGIGARWFAKFGGDTFPNDFCVIDGSKRKAPKYYQRLAKRGGVDLDGVEYSRYLKALPFVGEQSEERRAVREVVHTAQVRSLSRSI